MRFHIDQPPRPRNRRVIGWHLVQSYPQKVPQPQRIRCPPRYPPFAVDALEISDQQQAEIPSWRQTGPPHLLRVEARTLLLHVLVKAALLQQPVQLLVERMPHRPRQLRVRDPQFLLSSLLLFSTHSHAQILRISAVDHTIFFSQGTQTSPRTASPVTLDRYPYCWLAGPLLLNSPIISYRTCSSVIGMVICADATPAVIRTKTAAKQRLTCRVPLIVILLV